MSGAMEMDAEVLKALGRVLPEKEVAKKEIEAYIELYKHFIEKLRDEQGGLQEPPELVGVLWEQFLDIPTTEFIGRKELLRYQLQKKEQEENPASKSQKDALKRIRDFYPELDDERKRVMEKLGFKDFKDEDIMKITMEQAHEMLDVLAPLRNQLGYRVSKPGNGFKKGDEV